MTPTLLFDLDGTLVDSVPDLTAALNRLMAARGLASFGEREVTGFIGDGVAALVRRGFAARGVAEDGPALAEFNADYTAHAADHTRPFPEVADTLARLVAEGWRMAVCTNKPEAPARGLLAALGLAPFFVAIGGGDSFPVRKPDPGHLLATLAAAGGERGRAVMIGDHHNDINAARAAGLPSILAAWGYTPEVAGASAVAHRFGEIPGLAAGLLAA